MANIMRNHWVGSGGRGRKRPFRETYWSIELIPWVDETDYVWQGRRYVPLAPGAKSADNGRAASYQGCAYRRFRTKRKAFAACELCPPKTHLTHYFRKPRMAGAKGKGCGSQQWERDYIKK